METDDIIGASSTSSSQAIAVIVAPLFSGESKLFLCKRQQALSAWAGVAGLLVFRLVSWGLDDIPAHFASRILARKFWAILLLSALCYALIYFGVLWAGQCTARRSDTADGPGQTVLGNGMCQRALSAQAISRYSGEETAQDKKSTGDFGVFRYRCPCSPCVFGTVNVLFHIIMMLTALCRWPRCRGVEMWL